MLTCAGYDCRNDATSSALLGKSIQHVHRFAAFLQTIEYGHDICSIYVDRFKHFPLLGNIDHLFIERTESIFNEMLSNQGDIDEKDRVFIISNEVILRAIDLVSGMLHQMKIFMDDTNAPLWNGSQTRPVVVLPVNNDRNMNIEKNEKKQKQTWYVK